MIGLHILTSFSFERVKDVQEKLNRHLECVQDYRPIKADGVLRGETIEAIRLFQRCVGLPPDGVTSPGSATEAMLNKANVPIRDPLAACQMAREGRTRQVIIDRAAVVERKNWGASAAVRPMEDDWNYRGIVVHHAGNSYGCADNAVEQMIKVQKEETGDKGFADVGYHFGIGCDGTIFEGRDIRRKGEHVARGNTGLIGIVLLADFTRPGEGVKYGKSETRLGKIRDNTDLFFEDKLPPGQMASLSRLIDALKAHFDIAQLGGHREFAARLNDERSCPGDLVLKKLVELRAKHGLAAPR